MARVAGLVVTLLLTAAAGPAGATAYSDLSCTSPALFSSDWLSPASSSWQGCTYQCPNPSVSPCLEELCPIVWTEPCGCESPNFFVYQCQVTGQSCSRPDLCPPPGPLCVQGPCLRTLLPEFVCPVIPDAVEPPDGPPCQDEDPANAGGGEAEGPSPTLPPSAVGPPVSLTRGSMFFTHQDAAVGELVFTRTFNTARLPHPNRYGSFGPGWNASFEVRLKGASSHPKAVEARGADGSPQIYYDAALDGVFESMLPYSTESWVVRTPGGYRRVFRRGGEEIYDSAGRILSSRQRLGPPTLYGRDGQGRLSSVTRLGRGITIEYNGNSTRPARLVGPGNILLASYTYHPNGLLWKVEYPGEVGYRSGYEYDYDPSPWGRVRWVKDLEGKMIEAHTYHNEPLGRTATAAVGDNVEKLTFTYETGKTTVTDALANVTTYEYANVRGRRLVNKVTGPCTSCGGGGGEIQEWTYDAFERVETYRDGEGNITRYTYDPATGDLLTETRKPDPAEPLELVTRYTYHPDGRLKTREDPRGGLTTWTYRMVDGEEEETITELVSPGEIRTTVVWYNTLGKARLIIDPRLKETELFYETTGPPDLDYIKDPAGKLTHFSYDALGRRTQVIPPPSSGALEPILAYTVRGQVKTVTDPDPAHPGRVTVFTYDLGGRRKTVRDALNRLTENGYDDYGRLQTVTQHRDPGEGPLVTTYGYDLMSNLRMVRDARSKETWFDYDKNRLWKVRYPLDDGETTPREEVFTYDLAGRLKTRQDRRLVETRFHYDGLGRLEEKTYNGPVAGERITFTYDGASNLETATQGATGITWRYDLAGQVTRTTDGLSTVEYDYDLAGNRERVTLVETGFTLGYEYDDPGRLQYIRRGSDTFTYGFDDASRRRTLAYPNGALATYVPDYASRLDTLTVTRATQTLHSFDYDYDEVGNRKEKKVNGVVEGYGYDSVYRLHTVTRAGSLREEYGYDAVGNRKGTLALPDPNAWVYSNRNELNMAGPAQYSYDRNGNLVGKTDGTGTWIYDWDVENRLTRVRRNGIEAARFTYDPLGRRTAKIADGQSTRYSYDGEDIVREVFGQDFREGLRLTLETEQHQYVHGPGVDEPLAVVHGDGQAWYYHADGLGSIVGATDVTGTLVQSRSYDAFGNLEVGGTPDAGYAFTGREWDTETGLYYYRARYYDPKAGRFIDEDPAGYVDGTNLYAYVSNSPPNYVDPDGLLKLKNFPSDKAQQMADAASSIQKKLAEDPCCAGKLAPKILATLEKVEIVYVAGLKDKNGPLCGMAIRLPRPFPTWFRKIKMGPRAFAPRCGPVECTLIHEAGHIAARAGGHDVQYQLEFNCFGCGTGRAPKR